MNQVKAQAAEGGLIEKFQRFMSAVQTDFPAALEMMSDGVCWINKLPAHIPFSGEYHGKAGVMQYFQLMAESFELGEYDLQDFDLIEADNALVVVGCERNGKVIPTGVVFDLEFVWVVRFDQDGHICYLREHSDTAAIGDAFTPETGEAQ